MAFDDPWLKAGKGSPLDLERRLFEQTGNPIHVWRAYKICRELMGPPQVVSGLPDWVLVYLDGVSALVHEWFNRHDDGEKIDLGSELAAVMGFKESGQGTRRTAFTADSIARRDIGLAIDVRHALSDSGVNPEAATPNEIAAAVTSVAEDFKVAAAAYRAELRQDDPRQHPLVTAMRQREQDRLDARAKLGEPTIRRAWDVWQSFLAERWPNASTTVENT